MSRPTRDGMAEPVSRDKIRRRERRRGKVNLLCSADHDQDWLPYPVDPYSAESADHTQYTHFHTFTADTSTDLRSFTDFIDSNCGYGYLAYTIDSIICVCIMYIVPVKGIHIRSTQCRLNVSKKRIINMHAPFIPIVGMGKERRIL